MKVELKQELIENDSQRDKENEKVGEWNMRNGKQFEVVFWGILGERSRGE